MAVKNVHTELVDLTLEELEEGLQRASARCGTDPGVAHYWQAIHHKRQEISAARQNREQMRLSRKVLAVAVLSLVCSAAVLAFQLL